MASGSFKGGIYGDHYRLRVDWSSSPNIAGNYSEVKFNYYLEQDKYYDLYIGSRSNSTTIDGTPYTWTSNAIQSGGDTSILLGSTEAIINHDEDGTKTSSVEVRFNINATLAGVYYGYILSKEEITLDPIQRASSLRFSSVFEVGEKIGIAIEKKNTDSKHRLSAVIGTEEIEIEKEVDSFSYWSTGTWADGKFWSLSSSGQETVYGSLRVQTFYGGVYVGYKDYPFTAKIPNEYNGESIAPSVQCVLSAENSKNFPENIRDVFVKSRSKIRADFAGSFYNSSIGLGEYSVRVDGMTAVSSKETTFSSLEYLNVAGDSVNVVCSVTDASGRRAEITKTIQIVNYSPPIVEINSCDRVVYDEETGLFEPNKLGERIRIRAGLVPGTGYAEEEIGLKYSIFLANNEIDSGDLYSGVDHIPTISVDRSSAYTVRVWATDVFGDGSPDTEIIPVAKPVFHAPIGGNGFSLGMFAKSDGFFRSAYPTLGTIQKNVKTVDFLGESLTAVFARYGNVSSLTLHGRFESDPISTETGYFSIEIPEGFEPDPDFVTGENTVFTLWGRGSYITTQVGAAMISSRNTIKVYYNPTFAKNWTVGASLFWFNESIKAEE